MIPLYKNDYETAIVFTAKTRDRIIPLMGSRVVLDFISKATNQRIGGGDCEIIDASLGRARYTFKPHELAQVGEYQGKVTVELPQGARRDSLALDFEIKEK